MTMIGIAPKLKSWIKRLDFALFAACSGSPANSKAIPFIKKMMKMAKIPEISLVSIEVANAEEVKEVEVEEAEDVVNKKTEMLVEENTMMRTGQYIINKMIAAK